MEEQTNQMIKIDLSTWKQILAGSGNRKSLFSGIILFGMLTGISMVLASMLNMFFIDHYLAAMSMKGFAPAALAFLGIEVVVAFSTFGFGSCAGRLESHLVADVRDRCIEKLQTLSCAYYDKTTTGQLLSRVTSDVSSTMETLSWSTSGLGYGLMTMLASICCMFWVNWKLSGVLVAAIPPLALLSVLFQTRILQTQRAFRKENSRIIGLFSEGISGVSATKTLAIENENNCEFAVVNHAFRRTANYTTLVSNLYLPILSLIISFAVASVLYVGGVDILRGTLTIGQLNFFITISSMMFDPIRTFASVFADFQSAQAAAERVADILTAESEIVDSPEVIAKYGDLLSPKRENWEEIHGEVHFDHVTFAYGSHTVLKDFSLHVRAGETIALVGETGSGKSTIVNILCRFYEPQKGNVLIDGRDIRERSQLWLQSSIGYVLQTPHLFSGTIRENIRYGRLSATDEEVEAAARQMGVDKFALNFEKGYDTEVGESGNLLSTGQKQLVSFARAILAKPAIFVLDEATSSIDTETEAQIQKSIEELLKNRTSFVVAHRLSTIRNADRILVIDGGEIVEEGSHKELMSRKGRYYQLYQGTNTSEQEIRSLHYLRENSKPD